MELLVVPQLPLTLTNAVIVTAVVCRDLYPGAPRANERNLANLDYTERGWYGLFSVLTFPWLDRIDVDRIFVDTEGEHPNYAFLSLFSALSDLRTGYSFKELLSVFLKKPGANVNALLSTNEMNFKDFLNRAGKILPGLDADKIRGVKQLLNPVSSAARAAAVGS